MLLDYKCIAVIALLMPSQYVIADDVHDPTRPKNFDISATASGSATGRQTSDELKLQGVMNKKNGRVAIIAGQLYQLGDLVAGYKISQINNNNVVLIKSGTKKRLFVYE